MVRRLPPPGAPVVPGSTPVVSFGDPGRAEVATLGINPSWSEFTSGGGLLRGPDRRLATLESLGASRLDRLTDAQVGAVWRDCVSYFERNPYRRWFDPLDALLRASVDASYYDGSACHLDLVQWATDPVWGRIRDPAVWAALLEDGVPHLRWQVAHENVRVVLLNGRAVIDQVARVRLAELHQVGSLPVGRTSCRLYAGSGGGARWLGWSANLQSGWGITNAFKAQLADWVGGELPRGEGAAEPAGAGTTPSGDGHLPRGLRLEGKAQLVAALRAWLNESSAPTIGDVASFGGRDWVTVEVGGREVVLNADTKRAAVDSLVRASSRNPERRWRVVANRRGRVNLVTPEADGRPLPGWYAYLTRPLDREADL